MQKAVRDALIAFMAGDCAGPSEATREAQKAGIAHAKAHRDLLAQNTSTRAISEAAEVSRQVVYRARTTPRRGGYARRVGL
jgi:putative DNA-invertase from lambdoid prophage Rac